MMNFPTGLQTISGGIRNPAFYAGLLFIAANEFMQQSAKHTQKFKNETRGRAAETLLTGNLVMATTLFMKEKSTALKFTTLAGLLLYVAGGGINILVQKRIKNDWVQCVHFRLFLLLLGQRRTSASCHL